MNLAIGMLRIKFESREGAQGKGPGTFSEMVGTFSQWRKERSIKIGNRMGTRTRNLSRTFWGFSPYQWRIQDFITGAFFVAFGHQRGHLESAIGVRL